MFGSTGVSSMSYFLCCVNCVFVWGYFCSLSFFFIFLVLFLYLNSVSLTLYWFQGESSVMCQLCNTRSLFHPEPSFMPVPRLPHPPPTAPPATLRLFPVIKGLLWFVSSEFVLFIECLQSRGRTDGGTDTY